MKDKNLLLAPFAIALSLLVLPARGDEPLRPPHRFTECSPSGHSCVTSDPKQGTFAHKPGKPDPKSAIWKIPSWFRVLYPSDNPDLLVTGYDGANLVPTEAPGEIKVVSFWRHGKLLRSYKLSEVVHDLRHLRPTVSHLYWGDYDGFDADGNFRLTTVETNVLVFDPAKARLLRSMRVSANPSLQRATPEHSPGCCPLNSYAVSQHTDPPRPVGSPPFVRGARHLQFYAHDLCFVGPAASWVPSVNSVPWKSRRATFHLVRPLGLCHVTPRSPFHPRVNSRRERVG